MPRNIVPTREELVEYVDDYLKRYSVAESTLSVRCFKDPGFYRELSGGRDLRLSTARKLVEYIEKDIAKRRARR